jgi:superfamily II RNA helicase
VATALHFHSLASDRRSFYTSPIKALVNEKFLDLCRNFGPQKVGMITGDASVNIDAPIICCTAEILANMALRQGINALVDDVILDEFHYYSDRDRGVAWQIPLLTLPHCRFLLMSATLGDTTAFEGYLRELTGRTTVTVASQDRPVPLDFSYRDTPLVQTVEDLLAVGKAPLYLVNFTQRECAETAQAFLSIDFCRKEEKQEIAALLVDSDFTSPYGKEIKKLLRHGIGIHHGGLLPKYRILVESLAQKGKLKIICGTDTLGVGVNIPLRTVLFTQLCKYDGEKTRILQVRDFHQISGRAGRKGFDSQGSIVAQAPAHIIENLKMERKAALNPHLRKKMVKARAPEKGFVAWNEDTFTQLVSSPPEKLTSSFQVSHSLILNMLGRPQHGCRDLRQLIKNCHETPRSKLHLRKRSFQLLRSLRDKQIIEFVPASENAAAAVRLHVDLQADFSLTQTLSLYLLDTLPLLDPMSDEYHLQVLTLVESIVENPELILNRQLDRIKREKLGEMKAAGMEYDERIEELDKLEYPKPHRDFIYSTFNEFTRKHPWVGEENIYPKSIARDMYETYQSFAEYIKSYNLERVEGLLLRYLSNVYRVLVQTVPFDLKNDALDDLIDYFAVVLKITDSSLIDEWEKMQNPLWVKADLSSRENEVLARVQQEKIFSVSLKNAVFAFLRCLARGEWVAAGDLLLTRAGESAWTGHRIAAALAPFFSDHPDILADAEARRPHHLRISAGEGSWVHVELSLTDSLGHNDWVARFTVDKARTPVAGEGFLFLDELCPIA